MAHVCFVRVENRFVLVWRKTWLHNKTNGLCYSMGSNKRILLLGFFFTQNRFQSEGRIECQQVEPVSGNTITTGAVSQVAT